MPSFPAARFEIVKMAFRRNGEGISGDMYHQMLFKRSALSKISIYSFGPEEKLLIVCNTGKILTADSFLYIAATLINTKETRQ